MSPADRARCDFTLSAVLRVPQAFKSLERVTLIVQLLNKAVPFVFQEIVSLRGYLLLSNDIEGKV
jgi:hypothetical protein